MKIAFISANREKMPEPVVPYGLLCLIRCLPADEQYELWDLCFLDDPFSYVATSLTRFKPDLIALGLRNLHDNTYSGTRDSVLYYEHLVQAIRSSSVSPLIVGGSGFSVTPKKLMEHLRPDFGISGEGEGSFLRLLEALRSPTPTYSDIPGLHYFDGQTLVANPPSTQCLDMNRFPAPPRSIIDRRYYLEVGTDPIQTKRGCPLNCTYCTYPAIEGREYRLRSPRQVAREMAEAVDRNSSLHHVFIVDSVFNLPKGHAHEVCREMIRAGISVPWTCYINPLGYDEQTAALLAEAGCAGIEIGSDSGCDRTLTRLRKGFTANEVRNVHDLSRSFGLPDCHTFLLGTPGETLAHVHETLNFVSEMDPFAAILMVWDDSDEVLDPRMAGERSGYHRRILELLHREKDRFPYWIIPELGVNFDPILFRQLRRRERHGPLWQHLREVPGSRITSTGTVAGSPSRLDGGDGS